MKRSIVLVVIAIVATVSTSIVVSAGAQTVTPVEVNDTGVGTPPSGSGLGTQAALKNPKCSPDAVDGWGVFPMITVTDGPFCVAPAPDNNGGATYRGVTADTIKVVVLLSNDAQAAAARTQGGQGPRNQATGQPGTVKDAFLDAWAAYSHVYETWGRDVELSFFTSTGSDEAAQRADAVTVKQMKPMFVIDGTSGLGTLASVLAADKFIVFSYGTTTQESLDQQPYRWGQNDANAAIVNSAQFIGRQLAKKNVEFAGDTAMQTKPRTFGAVVPSNYDIDAVVSSFKAEGIKLATPPLEYTTNGSPLGDLETAQREAPQVISKLKATGVSSVVLFTDIAMTGALTKIATQQQYAPEWLITGYQYQDISLLARTSYDQDQWAHAFGISNLFPYVNGANTNQTLAAWYWGPNRGTTDIVTQTKAAWLAAAIQYAGPKLNPTNVQKGLFSVPARSGAASDDPTSIQTGWGKTSGLPYPSYFSQGADFAPVWYDAKTVGESQIYPTAAAGVTWFVDDGHRYTAGGWPKKAFNFFDDQGSLYVFPTPPVAAAAPAPCTGCPSVGGTGTPAAG